MNENVKETKRVTKNTSINLIADCFFASQFSYFMGALVMPSKNSVKKQILQNNQVNL